MVLNLHPDAHIPEVLLDDLVFPLDVGRPDTRPDLEHGEPLPAWVSGLGQESLGTLRVEWVGAKLWVIAVGSRREEALARSISVLVYVSDQPFPIDSKAESLSDHPVGQRAIGSIEAKESNAQHGTTNKLVAPTILHPFKLRGRDHRVFQSTVFKACEDLV